KSTLLLAEPRRVRDREHVRYVAKQPCLICGRMPSDPHHLRFAQARALGRKASDEFTVPLCRGHHRGVHRCRVIQSGPVLPRRMRPIEPPHLRLKMMTERHPCPDLGHVTNGETSCALFLTNEPLATPVRSIKA